LYFKLVGPRETVYIGKVTVAVAGGDGESRHDGITHFNSDGFAHLNPLIAIGRGVAGEVIAMAFQL
jgi:hypothetical protein